MNDEPWMLTQYYGDNYITNLNFCYTYNNLSFRQINLNGDTTFNHTWGQCIDCISGCPDALATNYNPNTYWVDYSICQYIDVCKDKLATNYNPLAILDDGSCTYCADAVVNFSVDVSSVLNPSYNNVVIKFQKGDYNSGLSKVAPRHIPGVAGLLEVTEAAATLLPKEAHACWSCWLPRAVGIGLITPVSYTHLTLPTIYSV